MEKYCSIKDLEKNTGQGSSVSAEIWAQLTRLEIKYTRNGKPYLELQLADTESKLTLKIWDNSPWYGDFCALKAPCALSLSGQWQNNGFGVEASTLSMRPLHPDEEQQLLIGSPERRELQEQAWQTILAFVASMNDPRLRALSEALLNTFGERFKRTAAARGYHHARRGGLVEHTAGVMKTADALSSVYPEINRDLVLCGALFHDCGKMWENTYAEHSLDMAFSEAGELLGHIPMGIEMINKLWLSLLSPERKAQWDSLQPSSEHVRMHLMHLVAAHHGELEFGSPVVPKTPEALILNHADNIDAKIEMFRLGYESSPQLSATVQQMRRPLTGNLVKPLQHFSDSAEPQSEL